jgi:hypothetical protein
MAELMRREPSGESGGGMQQAAARLDAVRA